jgi:hypothetical protein
MRIDLTIACLLATALVLNAATWTFYRRDPGRWRFFCGSIDHDHPTPQGADFCREMRACGSKR